MADTRTPEQRRRIMQAVGTKDTGPELIVRSALHRAGLRFRLHRRDLPGSPDLVFASRRVAVFVHGCFWHGHKCSKGRMPKSRIDYWGPKIAKNRERDARNVRRLRRLGWTAITVWECDIGKAGFLHKLVTRIAST
ncbi:MAG TPA: very short patch repair endonuclease [Caulobacterales bacterium]|nr:very short patch repair endonuclease [Caulobacterales bacterium]